jgi:iron complex outermembrane receptor protein
MIKHLFLISICTSQLLFSQNETEQNSVQFQNIEVTDTQNENSLNIESQGGQTLGDYLKKQQFLKSATFGPGVGRPVIKGLDGYRIGITNGSITNNDLSAMSHDHAVAMMPKVTQKIELIKGPSSLLYGNNSAGVIQSLGAEHENKIETQGLNTQLESSFGSNGLGNLIGGKLSYGSKNSGIFFAHYLHDANNYKDGDGNTINDSDTLSQQSHLVVSRVLNVNHLVKAYYDILHKEYGIPNTTDKRTWIDMEQERFGVVLHSNNVFSNDYFQTEIQKSDYLHTEYEASSDDGLFGQELFSISNIGKFYLDSSLLETSIQYNKSESKVCHEHGECDEFTTAPRTSIVDGVSLQQNIDRFNIPFSHGHPMPNIKEDVVKLGMALKHTLNENYDLDFSLRNEQRDMKIDSSNIQEEWLVTDTIQEGFYDDKKDKSFSGAIGVYSYFNSFRIESSLAYIQRLPSANELYWNGFHHATNSYIMSDKGLKNEKSKNLDISFIYENSVASSKLSTYYYHFDNYLFQSPLDNVIDPFHGTEVWQMEGKKAKLYGFGFNQSYKQRFNTLHLEHSFNYEMIRAKLANGDNIPRISPDTIRMASEAHYKRYLANLEYKYVDRSRHLAPNESNTPSYYTLDCKIEYKNKTSFANYSVYFKAQNLTNQQIYNHISFLKDTAPISGRAVNIGLKVNF